MSRRVSVMDENGGLTDEAAAGLEALCSALDALKVFTQRKMAGDDTPVWCGPEKVGGYALIATLEGRVMLNGAYIDMNDLKQYAGAICSLLYDNIGPVEFFKFMMELGPAARRGAKNPANELEMVKSTEETRQ